MAQRIELGMEGTTRYKTSFQTCTRAIIVLLKVVVVYWSTPWESNNVVIKANIVFMHAISCFISGYIVTHILSSDFVSFVSSVSRMPGAGLGHT